MNEETETHGVDMRDATLRDFIAAHALAGLGTWLPPNYIALMADYPDEPDRVSCGIRAARAQWAYDQADAMIAARRQASARDANAELARINRVARRAADDVGKECRDLEIPADDAEGIIKAAIVAIRREMAGVE